MLGIAGGTFRDQYTSKCQCFQACTPQQGPVQGQRASLARLAHASSHASWHLVEGGHLVQGPAAPSAAELPHSKEARCQGCAARVGRVRGALVVQVHKQRPAASAASAACTPGCSSGGGGGSGETNRSRVQVVQGRVPARPTAAVLHANVSKGNKLCKCASEPQFQRALMGG